ncbi:MAG TPA: thiamine pyrophosphate-binding protein, partial [Dehalococcoidia bacterium]|nr:thiamine pyrophosphate-binding protein [Dehalococcoidia bacterium]
MEYGSDLIVRLLQDLGIEYVSLNPGSSIRGLHDSIVNYGGNRPQLILCCHEEIAVAVAHGYAKATGRPMAVLLHNVVGLQHASMAILNAWADRVPMLLLGGGGPLDVTQRLPWIEWVHTAQNQGELVRDYVKWEEQPASLAAVPEAILRAYRIAMTEPKGPVYVCFDKEIQERRLDPAISVPPVERYAPPCPPQADPRALEAAAEMLVKARGPVIVADRLGRNPEATAALADLAQLLAAPVLDRLGRFNLPSNHPLNLTGAEAEILPEADLLLALDVQDLYGAVAPLELRARGPLLKEGATVIHISLTDLSLRSWWGGDCRRLFPVDLPIMADTKVALPALVALVHERLAGQEDRRERLAHLQARHEALRRRWWESARKVWEAKPVAPARLAAEVWEVIQPLQEEWVLANTTIGDWARRLWPLTRPHQWTGGSEAAGLGFGIGGSIGVALAHRGAGRLCIDLQGDGDLLYTPGALWTAANLQLP